MFLHSFLTIALNADERSVSRPGHITLGTHWVGITAGQQAAKRKSIRCPAKIELRFTDRPTRSLATIPTVQFRSPLYCANLT